MIATVNLSTLRADVTGKWSFEWRAYLTIAPLHILISWLQQVDYTNSNTFVPVLTANVMAMCITAIVFLAFAKTVYKNRQRRHVAFAWVLISGALLGASKGFFTGLFEFQMGVNADFGDEVLSRTLTTAILGMWLLPIVSLIFAIRERFQIQREALVAERIRLALEDSNGADTDQLAKSVIDSNRELKAVIASVREQLNAGTKMTNDEYRATAELFRRVIQLNLRPLSHRIWERENARYPNFSLQALLKLTVTKFAFTRLTVALVYFLSLVPALISQYGFNTAVLISLQDTVCLVICFSILRLFYPLKGNIAWFVYTAGVLITSFVIGLGNFLIFHSPIDARFFGANITNFVWIFELTIGMGVIQAARANQEDIEQELVGIVGAESAGQELLLNRTRLVNRELAQHIHGHLQNQVLASALRIEQAEKLNENEVIQRELDLVEKLLADTSSGAFLNESASLKSEIDVIRTQWSALLNLSIKVDKQTYARQLSSSLSKEVARILNEAIGNASRHGFASNIRVNITSDSDERMEIVVTDDGTGPRNGKPGLGSALFDSVAAGDWSLSPAIGGGSLLRIPIVIG